VTTPECQTDDPTLPDAAVNPVEVAAPVAIAANIGAV
jgi:hypothetical protein